MKFTKFGKALLTTVLSVGIVLGITSCVQSYTVGYLYVTGTTTAQSTNNGIISGFKIDHNTGNLVPIIGLPIGSGGSNPGRAVLLTGGRFIYVLNRGVNAEGGSNCTTADPCKNPNITQFSIGGNGVLQLQQTFYTQGINPFRLISDTSGGYLYVLDHDSPASPADPYCTTQFGSGSCGDITAFKIDPTTGRLTLLVNSQVTSATGTPLPYFPVPANPIDFVQNGTYVLTLSGTPGSGDYVFPYTYNATNGQLTINQNNSQQLNITQGTAIVSTTTSLYVLDNEPPAGDTTGANSQLIPYTVGTNGSLQAQASGAVAESSTLSNPIYAITVSISGGSVLYVANQGNNTDPNNSQSGIAAYDIITSPSFQLTPVSNGGGIAGTGAGPQCLLLDPSGQFVYTANFNDSTVTGRLVDHNSGNLDNLPGKANQNFPLDGPASWCMVTGRTS